MTRPGRVGAAVAVTIERARVSLSMACWRLDRNAREGRATHRDHLAIEAANLSIDMAVAETYSGRHPRIWSKEIPL